MAKDAFQPTFAVIGGSTAYELISSGAIEGKRLDRVDTPFGASQPVFLITAGDISFYFMSRHGERDYDISAPFVNFRANIYALKELGVKEILSWSAAGALKESYQISQFVVVDDCIDLTKNRETTFFRFKGLGYIRQHEPFCATMRTALVGALQEQGLDFADRGVYVCIEGPRMETPAEARMYAALGGDIIGHTLCPEVFLARELEMCYASVCYVTNYAEGVKEREFKSGRLYEGLSTRREQKSVSRAFRALPGLLAKVAELHPTLSRSCHCQEAMRQYRRRSGIGRDWREWLNP
jgi:5'-methylthioadenosine phosphorylase